MRVFVADLRRRLGDVEAAKLVSASSARESSRPFAEVARHEATDVRVLAELGTQAPPPSDAPVDRLFRDLAGHDPRALPLSVLGY